MSGDEVTLNVNPYFYKIIPRSKAYFLRMKGCSTGSISSEAKTILERAASTHGKSTGYEITSEPDTYRLEVFREGRSKHFIPEWSTVIDPMVRRNLMNPPDKDRSFEEARHLMLQRMIESSMITLEAPKKDEKRVED